METLLIATPIIPAALGLIAVYFFIASQARKTNISYVGVVFHVVASLLIAVGANIVGYFLSLTLFDAWATSLHDRQAMVSALYLFIFGPPATGISLFITFIYAIVTAWRKRQK